jgi:hypothetical protein
MERLWRWRLWPIMDGSIDVLRHCCQLGALSRFVVVVARCCKHRAPHMYSCAVRTCSAAHGTRVDESVSALVDIVELSHLASHEGLERHRGK